MSSPHHAPRLLASLALLSLPLAFQLAATAPATLPEGLWLMLVISIWAGLMSGAGLALCFVRLVLVAVREWNRAARARKWVF